MADAGFTFAEAQAASPAAAQGFSFDEAKAGARGAGFSFQEARAVPYNPALTSNDPEQIFPLPDKIQLPSQVRDAADAIENRYQYALQRTEEPDAIAAAGAKREQAMADLTAKAKAAKIPFGEIRPGADVAEEALAKEVQAARMSPEDVQALLPGKLPGGVVPPPGLLAKAVAPVESGTADVAGAAANPENVLYAAAGPELIPGFVAQGVVQGAAQTAGGVKKMIQGQPGGGEEVTQGIVGGFGMAALPAVMSKVLPTRAGAPTEMPSARPVDDWLPPSASADAIIAKAGANETPAVEASAPAPAEPAEPAAAAPAEAAPAAIPVGDEKADAGGSATGQQNGTDATEGTDAKGGSATGEVETVQNPPPSDQAGAIKTSPGATGEVVSDAEPAKTPELPVSASGRVDATAKGRPSLGSTVEAILTAFQSRGAAPGEQLVARPVTGGKPIISTPEGLAKMTNVKTTAGTLSGYTLLKPEEVQEFKNDIDRGLVQIESQKTGGAIGEYGKMGAGQTTKVLHQATGRPLSGVPADYRPPAPAEMAVAPEWKQPTKGVQATWLESNLGDLQRQMPRAPKAIVVQSVADLPARERAAAEARKAQGQRSLAMWSPDGNIYLVADNIRDLDEGRDAYLHEAFGHAGMGVLLKSSDIDPMHEMIRAADPQASALIDRLYTPDTKSARGRAAFVDEYVARASQLFHQRPRLFQRLFDVVYRAAARIPLLRKIAPARLLDAILRGLAAKAKARQGAQGASAGAGSSHSNGPYPDSTTGPKFSLAADDTTGTRQFSEQLQDATDISDALKGSVTNTTYTRRPQEDDAAYANRIMSDVGGPDQARAVFSDRSRLPSPVRMALGMQILKAYDSAGRHADAASFFDNDFAQHTTDTAQGLAMLNAWHSMSKDGKIFWARKKITDAARDTVAPVQPDIDAAKVELQKQNAGGIEKTTADPQVQGAAKDAITDAVTNSKQTHAGVASEVLANPEAFRMTINSQLAREQLRTDLDDLAKRAASIATGHYQGAESGVPLRTKLQQRLGLSTAAAGRLANALDKEFERQVNLAKNKVPKRVAAVVARQASGRANVRLSRSIPDRESEAAAKRLAAAGQGEGGTRPALQEFYQRLTQSLRALLPDTAGGKPKMTDLQRIAEAFSNPEKFEEVWQRLGTELRAKYGIEGMADVQNTLGKLTPEGLMETQLDRSIRQQLADAKVKIGQLVREHYTKADATKADLADKLVKQAGLDGAAAQKLAAAVKSRFDVMTATAKRAALERLLKPVKRLGLARPQMVDRLVQLSNIGAFDDPAFYNAIKERMNLPEWTPALRDQLNGLADKIGKIPADQVEAAQRAQTEFLNAIERAKGISNLELGLAFYMQNILSGLTTHVRVAIHTSAQMAAATSAEMARALAGGRLEDVPLIFEGLARGGVRALHQVQDILGSGTVVGSKVKKAAPLSVLEQVRFGQKGGTTHLQAKTIWPLGRIDPTNIIGRRIQKPLLESSPAKLLNLWKYNARLITAQHMLYYAPAEEMKVALLASRQARTEGLTGRAAVDRARQILGYGAAAVRSAEAQAIREGLEGTRAKMRVAEILKTSVPAAMKETARDYALRQTFLSDPYGFIGAVANSVANMKASENVMLATAARVIVPFTRIAANIFNEGLNYTPIGAARAAFARTQLLGHKFADITPEVRSDLQRELYAKSALGSMLLTAIAFKAAQGLSQPNPGFTVYGQGPNNPQDQAGWRAAGGIPFSVKVGNRYLSYANTPANVMLAALGNYLDGVRDAALYKRPGAERLAQNAPMRLAASLVGMGKVVLEQPFLQALVEMFKTSSEPNPEVAGRGAAKIVARTASSFVVPNLLRQLDRFNDPTAYSQQDLGGILISQIPFVRQSGRPMLNALGQPLKSPVFGLFTGTRTADPLVRTLVDHNAWPQLPDRNRTSVNGVPLTEDEFYAYCQERGRALTAMLSKPAVAAELDRLAQQRAAIQASAQTAPNPIARAKLQQLAAGIQNRVMAKYDAAADKQAAAAVIRLRGY